MTVGTVLGFVTTKELSRGDRAFFTVLRPYGILPYEMDVLLMFSR